MFFAVVAVWWGANDSANVGSSDSAAARPISTDQAEWTEVQEAMQSIREALKREKSLTGIARGIDIIPEHNQVTLDGRVGNAEEKARVEKVAKVAAGSIFIDSQLVIAP